MNAPFAWPTKYLPKFRTKRVVISGLGFLVASCSDGLTRPAEQPSTTDASAARFTPDVVIMERTTTDAANDGQAPVIHTSREVLTATVRLAGHGADIRTLPAPSGSTPQSLPRPPLFLPARTELAICSALPSWNARMKGANGRDIALTGIGDAPASTTRVEQADGSIWTIERTWTRTTTSWQLDRQVTKGSRGYRDVVTYRHENAAGKAVDNAIPTRGCAPQEPLTGQPSPAASRNYYAPYSSALYLKLVPGSGINAEEGCWEGGGDPCFEKRMAVYKADLLLLGAATTVTAACLTPAGLFVLPCATATTAYVIAVGNLAIAQATYRQCLADAAAAPKPTGPELSRGSGSGTTLAIPSTGTSLSVAAIGARRLNSCGGGSGDSGTSTHCHLDTYEISYDGGATWVPFATFFICDDAM